MHGSWDSYFFHSSVLYAMSLQLRAMNICKCICMSVKGKWGFLVSRILFLCRLMYELLFMLFWGFFFSSSTASLLSFTTARRKKKLTSSINVPCHALFYLLLLLLYFYLWWSHTQITSIHFPTDSLFI